MNSAVKILGREDLSDQVCVVVGTRPGIIKMSPIVKELEARGVPNFVLHTAQHYSYEMDLKFFEDLGLEEPRHHLEPSPPGSLHGEQTARMLEGSEAVFLEEKPRLVLVCGDANTNLAGALAARKLQLSVGHVESGLRSNDWRMPEEHNRIIIDHISEYLFAPTRPARQHLIDDDVRGRIFLTGNTIVEALTDHRAKAADRSQILDDLGLQPGRYLLVTVHREENVDSPETLRAIVAGLDAVSSEFDVPMVFPVHPRTKARLHEFGLWKAMERIPALQPCEPVGYFDFLTLLVNAQVVMTDSGGIQEESCIVGVPCVTLRDNTERQETVDVGANIVAGTEPAALRQAVRSALSRAGGQWPNPFGDGRAAARIVDVAINGTTEEWQPGNATPPSC